VDLDLQAQLDLKVLLDQQVQYLMLLDLKVLLDPLVLKVSQVQRDQLVHKEFVVLRVQLVLIQL
jgi:hypothetical protein